ncbi:MAG: FKBP-type peptidyl-prolyl cis-trans isomerase, partial [Gammaproteobacteria bacterium]|nr:FKBP-type peptidyl-prolyl cis-trans isomerase [Gammaproteobacteria bacterium]
ACGQPDQGSGDAPAPAEGGTAAQDAAPAVVVTNCPQPGANGVIEIQDGLTATITKPGYGRAAKSMDYADVHTTLWLYDASAEGGRGTEIWASGGVQPFQFQLDAGQVIKGWDLGVNCMLLGEKRELRIAPELGYGAAGKPPVPPNATLLFEIELVNLTSP